MNKQELIDRAVDRFNGKWPVCEPTKLHVLQYRPDTDGAVYHPYYFSHRHNHNDLCTKEEFTQRAKELGWICGYQWGKEYPTNGKKPDLPSDIEIEQLFRGDWRPYSKKFSDWVSWVSVTAFRIVDERYKPKDPSMFVDCTVEGKMKGGFTVNSDNSWHERGKFPPIGAICEVDSKTVMVMALDGDHAWVKALDGKYTTINQPSLCSPIKSEREKFVDAACETVKDPNKHLSSVFGQLFDSGNFLYTPK